MRKLKRVALGVVALFVALIVIGAIAGHKSNSSTSPPSAGAATTKTPTTKSPTTKTPTTSSAVTTTSKPKAQWEVIVSQSSCQENPENATVNCSIGVKNRGDSAGDPVVYAFYYYNDTGSSFDQSDNGNCGTSDPIPTGELGWIYFCHSYDAVAHDVIKVAVSLNENAKEFPYVRVADPDDVNWPDG